MNLDLERGGRPILKHSGLRHLRAAVHSIKLLPKSWRGDSVLAAGLIFQDIRAQKSRLNLTGAKVVNFHQGPRLKCIGEKLSSQLRKIWGLCRQLLLLLLLVGNLRGQGLLQSVFRPGLKWARATFPS